MKLRIPLCLIALLLSEAWLTVPRAQADIWRCEPSPGAIVYQNRPCGDDRAPLIVSPPGLSAAPGGVDSAHYGGVLSGWHAYDVEQWLGAPALVYRTIWGETWVYPGPFSGRRTLIFFQGDRVVGKEQGRP